MKDFETLGKRMPYAESDEYLSSLIERTTETAIQRARKPRTTLRPAFRMAVAAAVAALLVFVGITLWNPMTTAPQVAQAATESPVDDFLNNISDEDAQLLAYYEVEDIQNYEQE